MNKKQQHGVEQGLFSDIWRLLKNSREYAGYGALRDSHDISLWKDGTKFTITIKAEEHVDVASS